jgi:4-cresol dehydrogenase (hydroxylating) flavoprotein subunit
VASLTPPGVSEAAFQAALADFAAIVGPRFVFASDEDRASYMDPYAVGDPHEHEPSAAVAPASVEEVQAVLKAASRRRIPLWPISMGKNFAYGSAAPRLKGSVVLDLKRMNRIIEMDEALGYAVVEPGVSFFDLHRELERRGDRLWMSGPSHSWGSVIGNALEHGVGYTPYGVHADMICGMEIVLATGEVVRTGMGAVEGSREWNIYRHGYGPVWEGAFTQSNFGVVTKMGIWLMPPPAAMAALTVTVPREEDLEALVDTLRPLRLNDTINATYTIANSVRQVFRVGARSKLYQGEGSLPPDVVAAQLARQGDTPWAVSFLLFDRPEGLDLRIADIQTAFAAVPGAKVSVTDRWKQGEPKAPWMRQDVSLGPLGLVGWWGGRGGHSDFAPVIAPIGSRVRQVYDIVYRRFTEHGLDCTVGMFGMGARAIVMVADIIYDRDNAEMTASARALFKQLSADMAAIGVSLYRAHISFMDDAASAQTFGNHAFARLNQTVKAALDPAGVLAPGKQGIWPRGWEPSA